MQCPRADFRSRFFRAIPWHGGLKIFGAEDVFAITSMAAMIRITILSMIISGVFCVWASTGWTEMKRFFHSGDGFIHLKSEKNSKTFNGRYRDENQHYLEQAYRSIASVFGAPYQPGERVLSLRLIELLDLLEDQMNPGATLIVTSGYRAPDYNTRLRKGGALAAKASLHQYGMAADFMMEGVSSERIWRHVRGLGFGGTGYYHGKTVHVDVGPARFWDEKSSGVGTGLSDNNKLIGLVTGFDRYAPGEEISMRFIRMTAFPINVDMNFNLIPLEGGGSRKPMVFTPDMDGRHWGACWTFNDIRQMVSLSWRLPAGVPPGRYTVQATFCDNRWEQMPLKVVANDLEVRAP
ncbi:MAG: DUF882 domain-containing protein [Desulfobacteraceae bacterium]